MSIAYAYLYEFAKAEFSPSFLDKDERFFIGRDILQGLLRNYPESVDYFKSCLRDVHPSKYHLHPNRVAQGVRCMEYYLRLLVMGISNDDLLKVLPEKVYSIQGTESGLTEARGVSFAIRRPVGEVILPPLRSVVPSYPNESQLTTIKEYLTGTPFFITDILFSKVKGNNKESDSELLYLGEILPERGYSLGFSDTVVMDSLRFDPKIFSTTGGYLQCNGWVHEDWLSDINQQCLFMAGIRTIYLGMWYIPYYVGMRSKLHGVPQALVSQWLFNDQTVFLSMLTQELNSNHVKFDSI